MADKIKTERQARELGKVPENKRSVVMASALHETGDNPTAGDIRAAAERLVAPPVDDQKAAPAAAALVLGLFGADLCTQGNGRVQNTVVPPCTYKATAIYFTVTGKVHKGKVHESHYQSPASHRIHPGFD